MQKVNIMRRKLSTKVFFKNLIWAPSKKNPLFLFRVGLQHFRFLVEWIYLDITLKNALKSERNPLRIHTFSILFLSIFICTIKVAETRW